MICRSIGTNIFYVRQWVSFKDINSAFSIFYAFLSSTKNSSGLLLAINYVGRNQFCYSLFPGFLTNFCKAAKS